MKLNRNTFQPIALWGIWLFLFTSCINDIDLEIDMPDERISINCMHQSGSTIKLYAHKLAALDQEPLKYTALKMRLIENGVEIGTSLLGSDSVYYFNQSFHQAANIEIVDTTTHKTYAGALETLDVIEIDEAIIYKDVTKPDPEEPYLEDEFSLHQITFTDQKGVDNYYQICLKNGERWEDHLFINSPVFTKSTSDSRHRILFTDKLFKNKSVTLNIYSLNVCETAVLRNVSKSYFDYFKSLEAHYESQNVLYYDETAMDYFFQPLPVALYSNVTNGLGAFVSYSESQIPFKRISGDE